MLKKDFGLEYEINKDLEFKNSSGTKNNYYSKNNSAKEILTFFPEHSSIEALKEEITNLIKLR